MLWLFMSLVVLASVQKDMIYLIVGTNGLHVWITRLCLVPLSLCGVRLNMVMQELAVHDVIL